MGLEETVSSLLVGISGQREEQKKLISGLTCLEEKGTTSLTQASAASCQVWYVHKVCGEDSVLSTQSTACFLPFMPMWGLSDSAFNMAEPWHIHSPSCFGQALVARTCVPGTQTCGCGKPSLHAASDMALSHSSFCRTHWGSLMPYIKGNCCS